LTAFACLPERNQGDRQWQRKVIVKQFAILRPEFDRAELVVAMAG
jgi:hypothetical protein